MLETCRYGAGDAGTTLTCDGFCRKCGRGHIHTMPCVDRRLCDDNMQEGVRHHEDGVLNMGPDGSIPVDEMTHDYFWHHLNFEDPIQDENQLEEFRKCNHYCGDPVNQDEVCHTAG